MNLKKLNKKRKNLFKKIDVSYSILFYFYVLKVFFSINNNMQQ